MFVLSIHLFIQNAYILLGTKNIKMKRYNSYFPIVKNLVLYRHLLSLNSVEHLGIGKLIANIYRALSVANEWNKIQTGNSGFRVWNNIIEILGTLSLCISQLYLFPLASFSGTSLSKWWQDGPQQLLAYMVLKACDPRVSQSPCS